MYKCLGLFQKNGPVIVRPALNLCQALLDTEIRLPTSEFRMPYPIMGIELPEAIVKPHWPSLTIVWKMFPDTVLVWTMSPNTICYHNLIGDDLPTMEDRLIRAEACDDQTEYNLMVLGSRIALNLCMLATFRQTELTPLPPRVQRHRRLRDQRLNRLAARHCQEVLFKDLFIRDHAHQDYREGTGSRMATQHRRGHWKRSPMARSSRSGSGSGSTITGHAGMRLNRVRRHRQSFWNRKGDFAGTWSELSLLELARTIPGVFGEQLFYGCQAKESPYAKCEMWN